MKNVFFLAMIFFLIMLGAAKASRLKSCYLKNKLQYRHLPDANVTTYSNEGVVQEGETLLTVVATSRAYQCYLYAVSLAAKNKHPLQQVPSRFFTRSEGRYIAWEFDGVEGKANKNTSEFGESNEKYLFTFAKDLRFWDDGTALSNR